MKEKNIRELAKRMGLITVENMCQYTIAQLVVKIANKVNELVNEVWRFETDVQEILKTQNENIQYLLGEGLHLEVGNIFDEWVQDGTFDTLINQSALKKVNERIDETNTQLSLIRNNVVVYSEDFRYSNSVRNDDATTLSLAIDSLKNGGKLIINGNYDCDLVINRSNIIIEGYSGGITGTVNIVGELNNRTQYVELRNLNIINRDSDFTNVGVKLEFAERVTIRGCRIRGYDKSIYVPVRDTFQHVNRLTICDNIIERCNYCLYLDKGSLRFETGDVHFKNNQCYAGIKIAHIWVRTVDGIVIEGNTLFFPSSADRNMTKKNNIMILNADWVIIDGNNLFEAGEDGIFIRHSRDVIISNNHIAWPGQVTPACGIKLGGGYFENNYNITGNTIVRPTKHGIHVWDNSGNDIVRKASVNNNHIIQLGHDTNYYGAVDLSTVTKYAIANDNTNIDVMVVGNNCATFPIALNKAYARNNLSSSGDSQLHFTQLFTGTKDTVGDFQLNDNITRYSILFVTFGSVSNGTLQTEIVRPLYGGKIKVGDKFSIGNTEKIVITVKDTQTITIESIGTVALREINAIYSTIES